MRKTATLLRREERSIYEAATPCMRLEGLGSSSFAELLQSADPSRDTPVKLAGRREPIGKALDVVAGMP